MILGSMNIKKVGSKFQVESSSKKGEVYTVNVDQPFCDCPDFIFRAVKGGEPCKHVKAVKEFLE